MSLKEILCQKKPLAILQKAYAANRIPHAYIFTGPDGVGKYTTAKQWAKLLLCQNPATENGFADSCSQCPSCKLLDADSHPDFIHIYKELFEYTEKGKSSPPPIELRIDVIREFLINHVPNKPTHSTRKVFVVSESEKLNDSSQNALLKSLEEPPSYCSVILLCTRLDKLLATTRSRCQIIRFGTVEDSAITEKLKPFNLDKPVAEYFARFSQGSIGCACELAVLEQQGANIYKVKTDTIETLAALKLENSLDIADNFIKTAKTIEKTWTAINENTSRKDIERKSRKLMIKFVLSALSDCMKFGVNHAESLINADQLQAIRRLTARFDPETAAEKIEKISQNITWLDASVNEKLIFEHLLLNLSVSGTM